LIIKESAILSLWILHLAVIDFVSYFKPAITSSMYYNLYFALHFILILQEREWNAGYYYYFVKESVFGLEER
jgi:hypothetical protein